MNNSSTKRKPHLPHDFPQRLSRQVTSNSYREFEHQQLNSMKPKRIQQQLPDNMPRRIKRSVARSIARLEHLAMKGVDTPGFQLDYVDTSGSVSTFCYVPGNTAERMARDLLAAEIFAQPRRDAQA